MWVLLPTGTADVCPPPPQELLMWVLLPTGTADVCPPSPLELLMCALLLQELLMCALLHPQELLMCVLPLIDFRQLRGQLLRLLPAQSGSSSTVRPPPFTVQSRCVWCREPPVLPHVLQCCHLACYYCLLAAGGGNTVHCGECGRPSERGEVHPAPVVRAKDE